jgi:hypothetical protein
MFVSNNVFSIQWYKVVTIFEYYITVNVEQQWNTNVYYYLYYNSTSKAVNGKKKLRGSTIFLNIDTKHFSFLR